MAEMDNSSTLCCLAPGNFDKVAALQDPYNRESLVSTLGFRSHFLMATEINHNRFKACEKSTMDET